MRKLLILGFIVVLVAAMHVVSLTLAGRFSLGDRLRLVDIAGSHFDFLYYQDRGSAFGVSAGMLLVSACAQALIAVGLTVLFLSLVHRRYTLQLVLLSCIVGPAFVRAGERFVLGYSTDYFQLGFGHYVFPVFAVPDTAALAGLILLYGFIILRYLRLLHEPRRLRNEAQGLSDPFYERRRPLKVALGLFACWGALTVSIQWFTLFYALVTRDTGVLVNEPGNVMRLALLATFNALTLVVAVAAWLTVPKQPISALFLRSFQRDKSAWKSARILRKLLQPHVRLSGVVNPREARQTIYLLYWLILPFVFGVGDMGRVNAFRYNLFLTDDWKADLMRAITQVKYAIIDCRAITDNVVWELHLALEKLSPANVFLIVADGQNPLNSQASPLRNLGIQPDHCFLPTNMTALADALLRTGGATLAQA